MQINLCHRLIKKNIENGVCFLSIDYVTDDKFIFKSKLPKGLYATKDFKEGEILRKLHGKMVLNPTRESIHIGNCMHVIDDYGQYINHSFEPNVKIILNDVVALRDIKKYEEITFNYNESEINMACPFEINGVKVCGKKI